MKLDERTIRLISVGASIGANCRTCLETSIALALKSGAAEGEIEQAIAAGKEVRKCATKMDRLVGRPHQAVPTVQETPVSCCAVAESET